MNFAKFNDEVFYPDDTLVKVSQMDIAQLKKIARHQPRKRSRLCAHKNIESPLHEMIIVHEKGIYVRPHKHLGKSESFHVIEGEAEIIIFSDNGAILALVEMSDYIGGKVFYYRLSEPLFHTVIVKSEVVVFHETTNGPFRYEDTIYAPWSPKVEEEELATIFLRELLDGIYRRK
jgi:cupin fold WbuC family metalloprotein